MVHNLILDWTAYRNWKDVMDVLESRTSDQVMVRYMEGRKLVEVTGNILYSDIHRSASALIKLGIAGKRIGIMGKNSYAFLVNLYAILYTGSPAVVISKDYSAEEVAEYGSIADVEALLFDPDQEEVCIKTRGNWKLISMKKSYSEEVFSLENARLGDLCEIINSSGPDDLITILFTSGTTGVSKAVALTNRMIMAGCMPSTFYHDFTAGLVLFPFHHVAAYGLALSCLCKGNVICLADGPQSITRALKVMQPDAIILVPALLQIICQKLKQKTQEELGWNLHVVVCAGAKFYPDLMHEAVSQGFYLMQLYASTETFGRGLWMQITDDNLDTIGKPDQLMQVKLVDGELCIKGPTVSLGYLKNPEETAVTFQDGWYYSGDIARVDKEGNYYLIGRKKNLIILSNGENVSPEEIEQRLGKSEYIREILVHEEGDEIGTIIFPAYPEGADEPMRESIRRKVQEKVDLYNKSVPTYKRIRKITITAEPLEKTASMKIKRF